MSNSETILNYNYWNELNPDMKKLVFKFISKYVTFIGLTNQEKYAGIDFSCDPPILFENKIKKTYDDFEVERLHCKFPSCNNFSFPISEDAITQIDRGLIILTLLSEHINLYHLNDIVEMKGD